MNTINSGFKGASFSMLGFFRRFALALVAVSSFLLFVGLLASSFRGANAEELVAPSPQAATYYLSISDTNTAPCTSYDTTNSRLNINTNPGSLSSNCLTLSISTDNPSGYTLSIHGTNPPNLTHTTIPTEIIVPKLGSIANTSTFSTAQGSSWGFAVPKCQLHGTVATGCVTPPGTIPNGFQASYTIHGANNTTNTELYAPVPTNDTTISTTTTPNPTTHNYNIYFATLTATNKTSGAYKGIVTFTAQTNVIPPPPDIQTITAENCPTTRTMVRDARDDHTYWVQSLAGMAAAAGTTLPANVQNICWMQTNLAYAGGGTTTYGDTITTGTSTTTLNVITDPTIPAFGLPCRLSSSDTVSRPCVYTGNPNANPTSGETEPSTSTDGGVTNPQYGYHYNYCAMMNGTNSSQRLAACTLNPTNTAALPNQNANGGTAATQYNICPKGWRLPTGGPSSELDLLNQTINNGARNTSLGLRTYGLLMYGGMWSNSNGAFAAQGVRGDYQASTRGGGGATWGLSLLASSVSSTLASGVTDPLPVRCVAGELVLLTTPALTDADLQQIRGTALQPRAGTTTDTVRYYCSADRIRVSDARDGHTYWIRSLAGMAAAAGRTLSGPDICWMMTNLAYAGGGTNTYGDTIPAGTGDRVLNIISAKTVAGAINDGSCYRDTNRPCVYTGAYGANVTSGTNPSTVTTGGTATNTASGTGQYGYLYNWCAAMNGTNSIQYMTACGNISASQPNQSANGGTAATQFNICPAGWRLPTGNNNEMKNLNDSINGVANASTGLLRNGFFMYSGTWTNGAFFEQGNGTGGSGRYWSSTIRTADVAYHFVLGPSTASPTASAITAQGLAVRCVNGN